MDRRTKLPGIETSNVFIYLLDEFGRKIGGGIYYADNGEFEVLSNLTMPKYAATQDTIFRKFGIIDWKTTVASNENGDFP